MTPSYDSSATAAWLEPLIPAPWREIFARVLWDTETHTPISESAMALLTFVAREYAAAEAGGVPIYPPRAQLFRAFYEVSPDDVRVVLLGQDPYHGAGQAEGLSFSVPDGIKAPPSLRNIFKERETDVGIPAAGASPSLLPWARQGVLLLNTTLTVRQGEAGSHRKQGWERVTDGILRALDFRDTPTVFLLWGADARKKKALLQNTAHLVIESEHPSPLSAYRGFFGSQPFSKVNEFLAAHGLPAICWET
ncbi:MAG: uracil-DNA glycosylase [Clostridia bacterium]|nr:uracil-DNA glycosylase [Clostridia bacterium]